MKDVYRTWIDDHYPTRESAYGHCAEAVSEMVQAFSELRAVRGHYYDVVWNERAHWWCVTPEGEIVDPTLRQFPDQHGEYTELDEDAPKPTGMCPNCGELIFTGDYVCSDQCGRAYAAYCNSFR